MRLIVFNKPMNVLTRFTDDNGRDTLASYIPVPGVYPVGRLDLDSEGLLLLTDRGSLVEPLTKPGAKEKRYLVCVEGTASEEQLEALRIGPQLKDGKCLPAQVECLDGEPEWLWPRVPPIRFRKSVPVSWLELTIREGRNRQVRRMTAAVGLPTLRLVRRSFGPIDLAGLGPGEWRDATFQEAESVLRLESRSWPSSSRESKKRRTRRSGPSKRLK